MPGGSSSKQTTTQSSEPWSGAQPALKAANDAALTEFNKGANVYEGSTVTPWSAQTQQAMGNIQNNANANSGGAGLSGQYQNIINSGGYNAAQQGALANTQGLANSSYAVSPELQKVLDAQAAKVSDSVNLNASAAGRYGSGANQTLLATNVGDLANKTIYNDYTNFLGRKDAANNNLFSMGQQGVGNLGTAYTGLNAPNQDLMNVGSMNEDLATRQKNDELRIFDAKNNAQWDNIAKLNAIGTGAGSLGGTQTTSQPGQNPFLTAAGYGATGLGLLGSFF